MAKASHKVGTKGGKPAAEGDEWGLARAGTFPELSSAVFLSWAGSISPCSTEALPGCCLVLR